MKKSIHIFSSLIFAAALLGSSTLVYAEENCVLDKPCNISGTFGSSSDIIVHSGDGEKFVCEVKSLDKDNALKIVVSGKEDFSFPEIALNDIPYDPPMEFVVHGKFAKPEAEGKIVVTNLSLRTAGEVLCHRG